MVNNNTIITRDGDVIGTSLMSSTNPRGLGIKEKMAALHSID